MIIVVFNHLFIKTAVTFTCGHFNLSSFLQWLTDICLADVISFLKIQGEQTFYTLVCSNNNMLHPSELRPSSRPVMYSSTSYYCEPVNM